MDLHTAREPSDQGPFRNRLARARSPYLRAHGADPVDWRRWGPAAFEDARARGVPVFLSVGYAACHWCHVMHRESFSDPATAALLNRLFVSIKVDREEHPAVDRMAMDFLLATSGEAGWPASLFLDAEGRPLEGGTYFPPWPRYGMPAFRTVVEGAADRARRGLSARSLPGAGSHSPALATESLLQRLADEQQPDGGWGHGARFPLSPRLHLLLDGAVLAQSTLAQRTLLRALEPLLCGGLHDHLAGGFHRYCVDADWNLPHFEKMLYDNALLVSLLLRGASREVVPAGARAAAAGALEWMAEVLGREDGALSGSQDADDPVGEGHAATWTRRELTEVLGPARGALVADHWQVGDFGPAEGRSLLRRRPLDRRARGILSGARTRLLAARRARPQPAVHDQAVVAWNGLALVALAEGWILLGHPPAREQARDLGARLVTVLDDGRLPRTLAPDAPPGVLDDHGAVLLGLLRLHHATGEARWLEAAMELGAGILRDFREPDGRLRHTRSRGLLPATVVRAEDTAEPSGWGTALLGLQALHVLGWDGVDEDVLAAGDAAPEEAPTLHRHALRRAHPHRSLVITGAPTDPHTVALLQASHRPWRPDLTVLVVDPSDPGPLAALGATAGRLGAGPPRAWRCTGHSCLLPTDDPAAVSAWVAG